MELHTMSKITQNILICVSPLCTFIHHCMIGEMTNYIFCVLSMFLNVGDRITFIH